jgi:hypothetical protein
MLNHHQKANVDNNSKDSKEARAARLHYSQLQQYAGNF